MRFEYGVPHYCLAKIQERRGMALPAASLFEFAIRQSSIPSAIARGASAVGTIPNRSLTATYHRMVAVLCCQFRIIIEHTPDFLP
jgi:hypothetical protein